LKLWSVSENKTKITFVLAKYKKFEELCQAAHDLASGSGSIWMKG